MRIVQGFAVTAGLALGFGLAEGTAVPIGSLSSIMPSSSFTIPSFMSGVSMGLISGTRSEVAAGACVGLSSRRLPQPHKAAQIIAKTHTRMIALFMMLLLMTLQGLVWENSGVIIQ